jgi:hypothetical protein
MANKSKAPESTVAVIKAANIVQAEIKIRGTAPLVINKFSKKAKDQMMVTMATSQAEKKAKSAREPRNYDNDFQQALYISKDGWHGINASAFRTAMIDACRTVGLVMTKAKMSVFVVADGFDVESGFPLVRIYSEAPEKTEMPVRNDNGSADIRVRPMWREWECRVRVEFDADMITPESVVNLLDRAGRQVGICEGRPFSKNSCGMGWGTFRVVQDEEKAA